MIKALASIPLIAAAWLAGAWLFMLSVGVAHAQWIPALPTIGYRTSLTIGAISLASVIIRSVLLAMLTAMVK